MTETDTKSGDVGVITGIEHVDGEMIDMADVDGETRSKWIDHLKQELETLEGVTDVYGGGVGRLNNQTGQFEIELAHDEPRWGSGVEVEANLRSLGQKIPNTLDDDPRVSSFAVTRKPQYSGPGRHDSPYYVVEFSMP